MTEFTSFLGTGWSFPPNFSKGGAFLSTTSDEDDVQKSLEILLNTVLGERIMQPTYGCNLKDLLFEPINTTLETYIKEHINDQILYHEPRITLDKLTLDDSRNSEGIIEVTLEYTIASTNTRYNFVYPFYNVDASNLAN